MSTTAYRAALVREIEQTMSRIHRVDYDDIADAFHEGQLDAYAHILMLLKDEDL